MIDNMVGLGLRSRESVEQLREALVGQLNTGEKRFPAKVFFVDDVNGSDANTGLSPDCAFATIDKGVDMARYKTGTTTVDDTKDHEAWVFVAPGHYNEQLLFSGYNIHIIGLGPAIPGKDYGVSINYDGAIVAAPSVVAFSGSGIHLANLHICQEGAYPALYCAGGDNNLIENCTIECGDACTYGIQMDSMKGSWIRDCVIVGHAAPAVGPTTAGILLDGYCIDGGVERCQIKGGATAGCKGIHVANTSTVYNFRIFRNFIDVIGGGTTAKGIHNENADTAQSCYTCDNYLVLGLTAQGVTQAQWGAMNNHEDSGGTVTDPYADG